MSSLFNKNGERENLPFRFHYSEIFREYGYKNSWGLPDNN